MILVGRGPDSERIEYLFEGEDWPALLETAFANGCTEWLEVETRPEPGARLIGGVLVAPAAPDAAAALAAARAAMAITPRQLFIALASPPWSFITAEEAVAAATVGAMPAAVEAAIAGASPGEQMAARVTWARMQTVERLDPLVAALATIEGATAEEIDAFFAFAAAIE